jgi:hypothetical protein
VQKELRASPGLAFIRRYLSLYDFSQLEWITLRRSLRSYYGYRDPIFGKCRNPRSTSSGLYRIHCNVFADARYPDSVSVSGDRRGYTLNDENEAVIAIVAHEVSHYLGSTGQVQANGRVHSSGLQSTSEVEADEL